jgi:antirestriction protein ArdC/phage/plasmid primase-like uncharacterized protein
MTYRQAESVGAQVRRGEKGTGIQYWKWEGTRPIVDDSGRTRVNEQGHPQTERVQYARPRVFTAVVFNADQIEGLAPAASTGTQPPEWERHERAEGLLQASGVPILHRPGERAYYSLDSDHIVLPARSQFPTADNYYAVALHEVGHSTGHPSRLNRDMGHPFGSEQYAREELRAEIASLMMGDELSIGHDPGQHIAYVGSWIKALQNDPLEVFRAAAAAEKMQTYVLGLAQQQTAQQEQPTLPVSLRLPSAEERAKIPLNRETQGGDRYVVATKHPDTDEREKRSEHGSLIEAIGSLKEWDMYDRPALYVKAHDDHTFEWRFANPKALPSTAAARADPSWAPIISGNWNDDETGIIYLSPIPELEDLVAAEHGNGLDELTSKAIGAIARYKASYHHTGEVDGRAGPLIEVIPNEKPHVATERVNLMVPYREKDQANDAGAQWDKIARTWYAPPGADLDALARWRYDPSALALDAIPADARQEFAGALRDGGLVLDGEPDMDGVLHRVRVESDQNGQRSGAYVGYLDGHPAGFIQNYKTGLRTNWKSQNTVRSASDVDRQRLQEEAAARLAERQRRRMEHQEDVAVRARRELSTAPVAPDNHRYLTDKGFSDNVDGLRQDQFGNLLVPAHDIDGTVWSFQRISEGGDKGFLKGGRIEGCHALLMGEHGGIKNSDRGGLYIEQTVLIVVEGYATARTMRRATGLPVAAAFSSGNLLAVAQAYRNRFPDLNIIIAGDNDHRKPLERGPDGRPKRNVGKETAEAAAAAVGGYALLPRFATEDHGTDWNDFEQLRGREVGLPIIKDGVTVALVNIDGQRIAAGLRRFPVHHREADLERPSGPELGYVVAPTLGEARDKLRRGEWVATQSRATISAPQVDVYYSNSDALDRERADAQRTIERDRLRLADARGTGHNGESVAETLRLDEATAQRAETPAQARAALDMIREAAQGEAEQQLVHDQRRERRHSRAR